MPAESYSDGPAQEAMAAGTTPAALREELEERQVLPGT